MHIQGLRLLNQGADDVGLGPIRQLVTQEVEGLVLLVDLEPLGLDRLPARWHLIDDRNVHFTIGRDRQGPRDRGGRHRQDIRIIPLLPQTLPLVDPEAVLLIGDC